MENKCFIKTKDEETKNHLLEDGIQLLCIENGYYVFINDKLNFNSGLEKNMLFTNNLTF